MVLNAIAEKLKPQSKDDFKGRYFEAWLIVRAVTWYLRHPLRYRDLEEMFPELGFEVDHSSGKDLASWLSGPSTIRTTCCTLLRTAKG